MAASEAAAMPFPNEETTPPVMNMYLVMECDCIVKRVTPQKKKRECHCCGNNVLAGSIGCYDCARASATRLLQAMVPRKALLPISKV
jgi:hypothetical protein